MDERDQTTRRGEAPKTHYRSDRIVCENGRFYFVTRECTQEGPFDNKLEAEQELNLYIRIHNNPNRLITESNS